MKKLRKIISALLAASMLLSLAACGPDREGDDTGAGDEAENYGPAPAWPDAEPVKPMEFPEPTGDVAYTKIEITEDMVTGSTPWNNGGDVASKAFDGDINTFFDGVENGWIQIDLGERVLIGQIAFAPRSGYEGRLNGGLFYGSVDGIKWSPIYGITNSPQSMTKVTYDKFKTVAAFRYIKYMNNTECANISEIELYSAVNIPLDVIVEPERELYADGTAVEIDVNPVTQGMTKLEVTASDSALTDNNPSTLAESKSEHTFDLGGVKTVGCVAFMSDSSGVGGKFYGVKENGDRDLLWEITSDNEPKARFMNAIIYGKLLTTGEYTKVVFEQKGNYNLAEVAIYSMNTSTVVPLTALPFTMNMKEDINCVALNWGSPALNAEKYEIYRKREDGEFKLVYTGSGNSWQDYELPLGKYTYEVHMKYGDTVLKSDPVEAECYAMPSRDELMLYNMNNQSGTSLRTRGGIFDGNLYYSYSVNVSGGVASVSESTSTDGYSYGNSHVIVPSTAHPDMKSCKIESTKVAYVKSKNTVIIAAHWEKPNGYADGKLFLVTGTPGGEFELRCIARPLDVEVRDMSIFVDDDDTAYLLAAANKPGVDSGANATTYVFKFKDDYTGIEKVTARLFPEMYREMPNIVKIDGIYYFFVSQTSGWAPSAGAYAVSTDITDPNSWSELRTIGNSSTFGSQSSWILQLGEGENAHYLMHAYRWGPAQGSGVSGTMIAPITFSHGVAYYDYFPYILYNSETGDMIPVTEGMLLSQDAEVTATLPSTADGDPSKIVDGDYYSAYVANSATWPYSVTIDLGRECEVSNIQISWMIVKGSEAFYVHKIYGSVDGSSWDLLRDNSKLSDTVVTKAVGFTSQAIKGSYRYIKIDVSTPYRWKDSSWDNNSVYGEALGWYTPTLYEVKVYGKDPSYSNSGD